MQHENGFSLARQGHTTKTQRAVAIFFDRAFSVSPACALC